jgi:hypothetical protein
VPAKYFEDLLTDELQDMRDLLALASGSVEEPDSWDGSTDAVGGVKEVGDTEDAKQRVVRVRELAEDFLHSADWQRESSHGHDGHDGCLPWETRLPVGVVVEMIKSGHSLQEPFVRRVLQEQCSERIERYKRMRIPLKVRRVRCV